ncbi:MAG TPA: GNAT family N-acetyltransferase [Allosphingosinicella sp.]
MTADAASNIVRPAAAGAVEIRPFVHADVPQLLFLMRELAVFEDYIDEFAVTADALVKRGLGPDPEFRALVAADGGELVGMAVSYLVRFTWDLKPTACLKELFVKPGRRGRGIARRLFTETARLARADGAGAMRWSVLAGNGPAAGFYASLGGRHDRKWEPWLLDGRALETLLAAS